MSISAYCKSGVNPLPSGNVTTWSAPADTDGSDQSKRAGDKIIEHEEEKLDAAENHADVGHQLGMFFAIDEERDEGVDRKQPTPEKQRAFLPRPQRGEFIVSGQGAIAVLRHIRHGEIVLEKERDQTADAQSNQREDCHSRIAGALDQERMARADADDSGNKSVGGCEKRQD